LLEGKDMFQGCCHVRIGFSKLTDLKVKQNGPRSRDFTIADYTSLQLTSGGYGGSGGGYLFPPVGGLGTGFGGGFDTKTYGFNPYDSGPMKGCVLLVNNLTPDKITPDKLFILFGVYGDVLRVKILFNKRDTAMIQFASPQGAHLAHLHLNHLFLHSKEITVTPSKHPEISLPRSGEAEESAALTKDYTSSPIHRFKNTASRTPKTSILLLKFFMFQIFMMDAVKKNSANYLVKSKALLLWFNFLVRTAKWLMSKWREFMKLFFLLCVFITTSLENAIFGFRFLIRNLRR